MPLTFRILTIYTDEQAILRSRSDAHNTLGAAACVAFATLRRLPINQTRDPAAK